MAWLRARLAWGAVAASLLLGAWAPTAGAETGAEQQAAYQAKWRLGIAQAEARRRAVVEAGRPQERRGADPSLVGFVKAWWSQGRLALVEARSATASWTMLGDEQGRLLASVEGQNLAGSAFDEARLLRGGGTWWLRRARREAGAATLWEELRPASLAEVQAAERRWASFQRSLGRP